MTFLVTIDGTAGGVKDLKHHTGLYFGFWNRFLALLGMTGRTLCTRFFADAQNDNAALRMTGKGSE